MTIEIVNQVPEPTCPQCARAADLDAKGGIWIHRETGLARCPNTCPEHGVRCPAPKAPGTECCWQALVTKAHDEQERLSRILRDAREVLNGGESSESDFVVALADFIKAKNGWDRKLREDVGNWQKRAEELVAERDEAREDAAHDRANEIQMRAERDAAQRRAMAAESERDVLREEHTDRVLENADLARERDAARAAFHSQVNKHAAVCGELAQCQHALTQVERERDSLRAQLADAHRVPAQGETIRRSYRARRGREDGAA